MPGGEVYKVGQWVAVAYQDNWYPGKLTNFYLKLYQVDLKRMYGRPKIDVVNAHFLAFHCVFVKHKINAKSKAAYPSAKISVIF